MEKTLQELCRQYRRYRMCVLAFLPLLGAAAICAFFNRTLTLLLLGTAVAYQLFYLRRRQKQYLRELIRANLESTVCQKLGAEPPEERGGGTVTPRAVRAAQLMPFDETEGCCLLAQGITGTLGGMPVSGCDATFGQTFHLVKNGRKRVHFTCGVWVRLQLPADTGADWRLLDPDAIPTPIRQDFYAAQSSLEPAGTLDDRWVFYRAAGEPSGKLLRKAGELAGYTPGKAAFSLQGDTLTVFLRDRFLARPVSMKSAPTAALLQFDPLPELDYILRCAQALTAKK